MKNIILKKFKENKKDMCIILGLEASIIAVSLYNVL